MMTPVEVRPVVRSDAAELIRNNVVSRAYHEPWLRAFTDNEGFDAWFSGLVGGANIGLIAHEVTSGGVVGVINLSEVSLRSFQSAYLGYYGMVDLAGRGLMTEAVRKAARYAFAEVGLHRLEASIQPANVRSIELVRRIGFRREGFSPRYLRIDGVWCDHEHWALLSDEPML